MTVAGTETVVHVPDAWGDTENPMSNGAVVDKFKMLAGWAGVDPVALKKAAFNIDTGAFELRDLLAALPAPQYKEK
jgi:hypothetical protein